MKKKININGVNYLPADPLPHVIIVIDTRRVYKFAYELISRLDEGYTILDKSQFANRVIYILKAPTRS